MPSTLAALLALLACTTLAGSIYEGRPYKSKDFLFFGPGADFTDDTVCTIAVADTLVAIAGGLAEALFGIPGELAKDGRSRLPGDMKQLLDQLYERAG